MQAIKQMKRDKEPKRREEQGKRDSKKLCTLILKEIEKETHYYYCDGYQGVILVLIFVTNSHHFSLRTLSNGSVYFWTVRFSNFLNF